MPVSPNAIYVIPETRYTELMKTPEMQKELANKNVVVYRGNAKDAIDVQLCKMGIVPCRIDGRTMLNDLKKDLDKKFVDGLASISKSIGRQGLERVLYKTIPGVADSKWYTDNEQQNSEIKEKNLKKFFDFFFEQNPSVIQHKEKLLDIVAKKTNAHQEKFYTYINGEGKEDDDIKNIIEEIYKILGRDKVSETTNIYNEMETLAFKDRYKKYIESLPEIGTKTKLKPSQLIHSFEDREGGVKTESVENEFFKSLNKTLLKQNLKLPNGDIIPASEYVEKILKPLITESGTFKLKSGQVISARQFIEEYVFFDGQDKYNGDIIELMKNVLDLDDKDGQGMGLKQEYGVVVDEETIEPVNKSNSSSFADSLKTKPESEKTGKISTSSFKSSLETSRDKNMIGHNNLAESRNTMKLKKTRGLTMQQDKKNNNGQPR